MWTHHTHIKPHRILLPLFYFIFTQTQELYYSVVGIFFLIFAPWRLTQVSFERCDSGEDLLSTGANKDQTHGVTNYQARNNWLRYNIVDS